MNKMSRNKAVIVLVCFFFLTVFFGYAQSETAPVKIFAEKASTTDDLENTLDPEISTYELTAIAVNIQTKRAKVQLDTLNPQSETAESSDLDVQAEKTALAESLKAHVIDSDVLKSGNQIESAKLELKLLESKRDILISKIHDLESLIPALEAKEVQAKTEIEEGNRLLSDLQSRRAVIDKISSQSDSQTLSQRKIAAITDLIKARETHLDLLSKLLSLLTKRIKTIQNGLEIKKQASDLYDDYVKQFLGLISHAEENLARQNFQAMEKEAQNQIQRLKQEMEESNPKLEQLETSLLSFQNASTTSQQRPLAALQRDTLLAQRDGISEGIRHFELIIRKSREFAHLDEIERKIRMEDGEISGSTVAWAKDLLDKVDALAKEMNQNLILVQKRKELLNATKQLLERSYKEFASRKSSVNSEESALFKEENIIRKSKVSFCEIRIKHLTGQERSLQEIFERSSTVRDALSKSLSREKERLLFSRNIYRPRPAFLRDFIADLTSAPGMMGRIRSEAWNSADIGDHVVTFFLLIAGFVIGAWFRNFAGSTPLEKLRTASGIFWIGSRILGWLNRESWLMSVFMSLIILGLRVPSLFVIMFFPALLMGARLIYTLSVIFIREFLASIQKVSRSLEKLAFMASFFLPLIYYLRFLQKYHEISFFIEMSMKIAFIFPIFRLLFSAQDVAQFIIEKFSLQKKTGAQRFLLQCYRFVVSLTLLVLFLALYGYDNLAFAVFVASLQVTGILLFLAVGRSAGDRLSKFLFDPEHGLLISPESVSRSNFFLFVSRKLLRFTVWVLGAYAVGVMIGVSGDTPMIKTVILWLGANSEWIYGRTVHIIIILIGVGLILEFFRTLGESIVAYVRNEDPVNLSENERRVSTLVQIMNTTARVITFCIAGIMILKEMGMDITPLLTGAGIVGVAIGFGSQSLVKDFFSGFFILVENQFRVGDVVEIGDKSGVVERINLKTTVLRDIDGSVHIIPNGEIHSVKNMTYAWSRAVLDVGISYDADIDNAVSVLKEIGAELASRSDLKSDILGSPEVLGVESLGDSAVTIRMLVKTKPLAQWNVARIFRKKIKEMFDKKGIVIPYPHHVVILRTDVSLPGLLETIGNKSPDK